MKRPGQGGGGNSASTKSPSITSSRPGATAWAVSIARRRVEANIVRAPTAWSFSGSGATWPSTSGAG